MIKLVLGNVGSGKTASMVRYMRDNPHKNFITNINTTGKDFKHVEKLKANMILKKSIVSTKRDGTHVYKLELNVDFWKNLIKVKKQINIIIDEAHVFFNPRRSMSKINIIMTDFLALLRRVLGSGEMQGELILITQLSRRLDIISKEMATDVIFHICHYREVCKKCNFENVTNNEIPNNINFCPRCHSPYFKKENHTIEVMRFKNIDEFSLWYINGVKTYYSRYMIKDIHTIFKNYDTLQFDDLLSEY